MLTEARIEIVDPAGHVEDRVSIVGGGAVGLSTRGHCEFHAIPFDRQDDADVVITLHDGAVSIQAKTGDVLRVDGEDLGSARVNVSDQLIAFIAAVQRHLRVTTIVITTDSLLSSAGAVIHSKPSRLEMWATRAAARGVEQVSQHLARLRARGIIDRDGNLLVPLPRDMEPDSPTDV